MSKTMAKRQQARGSQSWHLIQKTPVLLNNIIFSYSTKWEEGNYLTNSVLFIPAFPSSHTDHLYSNPFKSVLLFLLHLSTIIVHNFHRRLRASLACSHSHSVSRKGFLLQKSRCMCNKQIAFDILVNYIS